MIYFFFSYFPIERKTGTNRINYSNFYLVYSTLCSSPFLRSKRKRWSYLLPCLKSKPIKRKKRKPKMNEMKMKAKKTRNELKVSDTKTYLLKNEERMKNSEERWKTFTDLLTETSWKSYGSTSACIFFMKKIFFTQNTFTDFFAPPSW